MQNWEDILSGYLEGRESRADAEALRWKIHLPVEVREEVEAVLRLADEVAAAMCSVAVPEGAVPRLQHLLHEQPQWATRPLPAAWWQKHGGFDAGPPSGAAPAVPGEEDAVNAMIEGAVALAGADESPERGVAGVAGEAGESDEEWAGRLEQVRVLVAGASSSAGRHPPKGAVDRLVSRLHEDAAQGALDIDEETAGRFLDRLKTGAPRRPHLPVRPDVLAASADAAENAGRATGGAESPDAGPSETGKNPPRSERPQD